jgi:hypothetical protein
VKVHYVYSLRRATKFIVLPYMVTTASLFNSIYKYKYTVLAVIPGVHDENACKWLQDQFSTSSRLVR